MTDLVHSEGIKVIYRAEHIHPKIDDQITRALKAVGFRWRAQGFNLVTNERDIAFDLPSKKSK